MRHRPLAYWLDYVRGVAAPGSPVVLVQARCDGKADRSPLPPVDLDGLAVRTLEVSAKTGRGLATLRAEICEAVGDLLAARPPQLIGRGRAAARDRLRQMLAADQGRRPGDRRHRTLGVDEFEALCAEVGGVSSPGALLTFFHRTGVVFHQPGVFGGRVVLDQQWALDAIYSLLERGKVLPLFRNRGRFTRDDLGRIAWQGHAEADQDVFLGMMESCGICFRVRENAGGVREYVAPELLPAFSDARRDLLAGRIPADAPHATATARFPFLHEGVLRTLLSRIGAKAGDTAVYWKYGCWFYEETTDGRAMVETDLDGEADRVSGAVTFKAWGRDPVRLLEPLLAELDAVTAGRPPDVVRSWDGRPPRSTTDAEADTPFVVRGMDALAPADPPDDGRTEVCISYAHGDDLTDAGLRRGRLVDDLQPAIAGWGYRVRRDRDVLRDGDLIHDFMLALGQAGRVVVVLSDKYLRSVYCMTDLHHIFEKASGAKKAFTSRVVPVVLDDVRIDGWRDRAGWAAHWQAEFQEMERHFDHLGAEDRALCVRVKQWHAAVGDMLAFLADVLTVRGEAAIRADGFRAVRALLDRR